MDPQTLILLEAVTVTSIIGILIVGYMKMLRRRLKRYVLRWEKIEKHFREKSQPRMEGG